MAKRTYSKSGGWAQYAQEHDIRDDCDEQDEPIDEHPETDDEPEPWFEEEKIEALRAKVKEIERQTEAGYDKLAGGWVGTKKQGERT